MPLFQIAYRALRTVKSFLKNELNNPAEKVAVVYSNMSAFMPTPFSIVGCVCGGWGGEG